MPRTRSSKPHRSDWLAAVLREARERAGLSQRELAKRVGVSWVAISNAERGADVGIDTLRGYLRAPLGLTPSDLLRRPDHVPVSRSEVWTYYRDLVGFVADEIAVTLTVHADGCREETLRCKSLRRTRSTDDDLAILLFLERAVLTSRPSDVRAIEAEQASDELRVRSFKRSDGGRAHQLAIPAQRLREGLSYGWTRQRKGVLRAADSKFQTPAGGVHAGFSHDPAHPTARLRLRVVFPEGYWPEITYSRVWLAAAPPDPDARDLGSLLHPEGPPLRRDRSRRTVSWRVDRPLPGFAYGLGWCLP